jgi:hypothetical protein
MRTSKDPMEPLRCWKELLVGERAFRPKRTTRFVSRRNARPGILAGIIQVAVGE